ncbi:cation:proton antiporter [Sphingomonas jatrophae]|uniref:Sodium/proton antiporter, CPA1 family n=1 Tax=Sphingomonas jatrophae TaxID=1166337 RepID=A0A1I6MBG2_9SPHN|nr:cation:proton antiporter [Sphingomonas jatrophae]SFS13066.1 sodium/proton antiporter, CPA1 family [Sphingomonas jatrophae]
MPNLASPEPYILAMTGFGVLVALVAWLPLALRRLPLSLPICCIGLGLGLFALPGIPFTPSPMIFPKFTEHMTEVVVIIALMGAGLKLDRSFDWREWRVTWRLLAVTMPLSIFAIAWVGGALLALPAATALLLGAALAPTDPVLASDVQVGPPKTGEEDEVRFGLTSEAGLNDGLAFPFVYFAIALAAASGSFETEWVTHWFALDILWKGIGGVAVGWLIGRATGWLTFHMPAETRIAQTGDGLIALAATFFTYGVGELLHVYGFVAVFICALTLRAAHRNHDFQRDMHDFTEQVERLVMMCLLLLFGGALLTGLLAPVGWREWAAALLILLVVRPATGLLGMIGLKATRSEKLTLAFFGIRGVGSFYYMAFAATRMEIADEARVWAIVGLVVLLSILLHGLTVTPIMRTVDRLHGRDPDADHAIVHPEDEGQTDDEDKARDDPATTPARAGA